ncbi:Cardiolipin synthase, ClsA [hydrothermal vent metagenome]|uniref:Cardiolipin synthase, ClsA n=1 Tax=hydrothermal vent metagenome TaxID=652676 RepID=A0A3B0W0L1_9ZZZZ
MIEPLTPTLSWVYFLYIFFVIGTVLHMLYQRRSPQNLMVWLLTLLLLPFIGLLLYIFFGSRKFLAKRKTPAITLDALANPPLHNPLAQQINQLLQANQISSTTHNNLTTIHENATDMFHQIMSEIQRAQTSIHLQTYVFQMDCTGQAILNALIQKAQQGVDVRLLMDAIGSFSLYKNRTALQPLVQAGGHYAFFQPLLTSLLHSRINLRNHRKIYLFDQSTLLTGGVNISNDYFGSQQTTPAQGRWKDLMLKIQGTASLHHQYIFNADWFYTTNQTIFCPQDNKSLPIYNATTDVIQTIPSGPDIQNDPLFESLLHNIYNAQTSINIVTPYLIPDSAIMNALLIAIKRGVKVHLIIPKTSDHFLFDLGRTSYMREIVEAGGCIDYEQSAMLHAKMILIDDRCLILGSANLDYRSLFINHEIVNILYSKPLIQQMKTWFTSLQKNSKTYQPMNSTPYRLLENLTRIFTPLL